MMFPRSPEQSEVLTKLQSFSVSQADNRNKIMLIVAGAFIM